jgi:hypothetical protein
MSSKKKEKKKSRGPDIRAYLEYPWCMLSNGLINILEKPAGSKTWTVKIVLEPYHVSSTKSVSSTDRTGTKLMFKATNENVQRIMLDMYEPTPNSHKPLDELMKKTGCC